MVRTKKLEGNSQKVQKDVLCNPVDQGYVWDPLQQPRGEVPSHVVNQEIKVPHKSSLKHNVGDAEGRKWLSLFGKNPTRKSSFPLIVSKSCWEKGEVQIIMSDPIVDYSISSMDFILIRKFVGARTDIDALRNTVKRKWTLQGQVDIMIML